MSLEAVSPIRIQVMRDMPPRVDSDFVLYWMTAFRRTQFNRSLQHACHWSLRLKKPLLIFEPLRLQYRWASDRFHRFIIDGMLDNQAACLQKNITYFPYIEEKSHSGSGLIEELAERAAIVVGDEYPCFFLRHLPAWFAKRTETRFEIVDSNGLLPLRANGRLFTVAHSYRRHMQKTLPSYFEDRALPDPLKSLRGIPQAKIPKSISGRWQPADLVKFAKPDALTSLPIDHEVSPTSLQGGSTAARRMLANFLGLKRIGYDEQRNHPDMDGSSGLSPYLHFGHIAADEIFWSLLESEQFKPEQLSKANGKMNGFWNLSPSAEAFLDQLLTWREIGFNQCYLDPRYDRFESLPAWAQKSLQKHAKDQRAQTYSLEQFERAETHDPLWNAAQRQLVRDGKIHNYLRMLWGKKILHWSESPEQALKIMIELNNKYALDGRDPNSYSGIFWVLGRYDRPWGPEREIFGSIRYMTSDSTLKKVRVKQYLKRYAAS